MPSGLCRSIACVSSADCLAGETCSSGRCEPPACRVDGDCPAGDRCRASECFTPECTVDSDCARGGTCADGICGPACSADLDCGDERACNGLEQCRDGECIEGTPVSCDDEIACTLDSCVESTGLCEHQPVDAVCGAGSVCEVGSGCSAPRTCRVNADCDDDLACTTDRCDFDTDTCSSTPADMDSDGAARLGCLGGLDCDDGDDTVFPGAMDVCDGVDRDCNGVVDDGPGLMCALGSAPTSCVTACGVAGTRACNSRCSLDPCVAAEICRNGCDDDADGRIDEGCPPGPANDHCAGAITVTAGTRRSDPFRDASRSTAGCGDASEIFYVMTLPVRTIVYISTLGTTFDTLISHRGGTCPGVAGACVDDACGGTQSQWVGVLPPGRQYFAIHAASGNPAANVELQVQALPAGTVVNRLLPGSPTSGATRILDGPLSGTGTLAYGCGADVDAPENTIYWTQCPGERRSVTIEDCVGPGQRVTFDGVLSLIGPSGEIVCANNNLFCDERDTEMIDVTTSDAGLYQSVLDSSEAAPTGSLYHRVRLSAPL